MSINNPKKAVLMPTYNRAEAINDTLRANLARYKNFNYDVYVFDSSNNRDTENYIKELQKEHDNLFYIRMCEFTHLDSKWLDMVRGKYVKKDYDYFYPCGEANALTVFALEKIEPYLKENVTIVNINDYAKINKTSEFNNANDFFNSAHANIGQWGGVIYNYKAIFDLNDNEWNDAISKWFTNDLEYIGLNGFLWERISLCKNLRIVEPSMEGVDAYKVLRRSKFKEQSFWRADAIKLIAITYPKVYRMLPNCYTNIQAHIEWLIKANFKTRHFKFLKKTKGFNLIDFFEYKKIFDNEKVKVLNWKIFLLALLPNLRFNK